MTDPIAAVMDAGIKRLNGSIGLATILLLLSIVVLAVVVFFRSNKARTLPGFVRFMVLIGTLTHASIRADVVFWASRKPLMLQVALPTGALIAIARRYANRAVSAALLGHAEHMSDRQAVSVSP